MKATIHFGNEAVNQLENMRSRLAVEDIGRVVQKGVALLDVAINHKAQGGALIFRHADGTEEELKSL